jgi:hypothetical protein
VTATHIGDEVRVHSAKGIPNDVTQRSGKEAGRKIAAELVKGEEPIVGKDQQGKDRQATVEACATPDGWPLPNDTNTSSAPTTTETS